MAAVSWLILLATFFPQCLRDEIVLAGRLAFPLAAFLNSGSKNKTPHYPNSHTSMVSALGDPGMRSDKVRVAVEGWNFCNRAGNLSDSSRYWTLAGAANASSVSPRWADCTDLVCEVDSSANSCKGIKKVTEVDNLLSTGDAFPSAEFKSSTDPDIYAIEKEKYLGARCAEDTGSRTWSFWMIMLKNGNFDESSGLCPIAGDLNFSTQAYVLKRWHLSPSPSTRKFLFQGKNGFPCFGPGCMNQPLVFHNWSTPRDTVGHKTNEVSLAGGFYGTYDHDEADAVDRANSSSFFSVTWRKREVGGSWEFNHLLRVSTKYPWLMLYLRADVTSGPSGGYPWDTRGLMHTVPQSPNFKVVLTLNISRGGGPESQFYLLDIGGCWKNDGKDCDGNLAEDVTRYSEMIINPDTPAWCRSDALHLCPPFHTTINGTKIHRSDIKSFPYSAYHLYCVPSNARHAEAPYTVCDPYSNPQAQELQQLLPHPEWAVHGYPSRKGQGWVGDARTWELDAGALSSRLYFYQDPGSPPARRKWPSIDVGTEIYISSEPETAEWKVRDFNVLVPMN